MHGCKIFTKTCIRHHSTHVVPGVGVWFAARHGIRRHIVCFCVGSRLAQRGQQGVWLWGWIQERADFFILVGSVMSAANKKEVLLASGLQEYRVSGEQKEGAAGQRAARK